jgi:hypothetical protein
VAALSGVVLTAFLSGRQEAQRRTHEQALKIREERLLAYATMATLTKTVDPSKPPQQGDLGQALSEIELLTDSEPLMAWASTLADIAANTRNIAWNLHKEDEDLAEDREFQEFRKMLDESRSRFVWLARAELRGKEVKMKKVNQEQRGTNEQREPQP